MSAFNTFVTAFNSIANEVEFSPKFPNGTGYFNNLAEADLPDLQVGDLFKTTAPAPDSRRIIGVVTPVGNVVFFERYTHGTGSPEVITLNMPRGLVGLYPTGSVSDDTLFFAIGGGLGHNYNIGQVLARVISAAPHASRHKHFGTPGNVIRDVLNAADPEVALETIEQWKVEYKQHVSTDTTSHTYKITDDHGGSGRIVEVKPE